MKDAKDIENPKSKQDLVEGLKLLHNTVNEKYTNTKTVTSQLTTFYGNLTNDHKNFEKDYNIAVVKIEGDKGEMKALSTQLDAIQSAMDKDIGLMAGGAVAILAGVGMIIAGAVLEIPSGGLTTALIGGGVLVVSAGAIMETFGAVDYSNKIEEQKKLNEELAEDKLEMTALKSVKGQLDGLKKASKDAIAAAQTLMSSWQGLGADLNTVIDAINTAQQEITSSWLEDQLTTAYKDWQDALEKAKQLQPNGQAPVKIYKDLQDAFKEMKPQG